MNTEFVTCSFRVSQPNSHQSCYNIGGNETDLFNINICSVYAARWIGTRKADMEIFCGVMNLPSPTSRFQPIIISLFGSAVGQVCKQSMRDAF